MNSAVDAIIFDLGNVLLHLDWDRPARALSAKTGRSRDQLELFMQSSPLVVQLSTGEVSMLEFYELVREELEYRGTAAEFHRDFADMFDPNEAMLGLAHGLKGQLPRLILSNTNAIHTRHIFTTYPQVSGFDGYILSHEVGIEKPDPRIYQFAVKRHRLDPRRTVFIDDLAANVAGARAVGLQGIHYQDFDQTKRELTNLGLPLI
jgi:putative hydrolase of the HAD superfamily